MNRMSVSAAKARFSELIERAESGRPTVITKHGRVVAKIVPASPSNWDRTSVLAEAEAFRNRAGVKGLVSIRKLIEEGRR